MFEDLTLLLFIPLINKIREASHSSDREHTGFEEYEECVVGAFVCAHVKVTTWLFN